MSNSIAVIISTYNSPAYLRRVLQGYAGQARYPDELIVADDGSTSETASVVEDFLKTSPFPIKHIWHEDTGFRLAEIRNKAISAAASDYIIFSDGDCIPHPDFVKDHACSIQKGYFVTGKRMLVSKEFSPIFTWKGFTSALFNCMAGKLSGCHHLIRLPWVKMQRKGIFGLRGCNMAMFRSDLIAVNGFNEKITGWGREDSEIVARLYLYGLKRLELPFSAIVFHLWHPENSRLSLEKNDMHLQDTLLSDSYRCSQGIDKTNTAGV